MATKRPATKKPEDTSTSDLPYWVEGGLINDRSGKATENARQKIRQQERQKQKPRAQVSVDPIERGVRRIFRMTAFAGFDPPTPQEIEQILVKSQAPKPMPGVRPHPQDKLTRERSAISALHKQLNDTPMDESKVQGLGGDSTFQNPMQRGAGGALQNPMQRMTGPRPMPALEYT